MSAWRPWLDAIGIAPPDEPDDEEWPQHVVRAFCDRHRFASKFTQLLQGAHND
jgi:hypothetical protein